MQRFNLSERQAQAILDMQLRRLAALERQKIEDEQRQTLERIAFLEDLLAHPKKILTVIKEDLEELAEKYGDERRTLIAHDARESFSEADLVADETVLISITQRGYIKRVATKTYKTQGRGGRGVTGHTTREEDEVLMLIPAGTLDTVLFFSDKGKVYSQKTYNIPDADRTAKGIPIVNVLALDANETITAAVTVSSFTSAEYLTMATRKGRIKRVALSEFASVRPSGLIAITLDSDDQLGWVRQTHGKDEVILVSEMGQALRFHEEAVRMMGRSAGGVTAMRLRPGDYIASMEVIEPNGYLLVVTDKGFGKRTSLNEYPTKGRATGGVMTIDQKSLDRIGNICSARVVQEADDVTLISSVGVVLRLQVQKISVSSRATRGVQLMGLGSGDSVASLARVAHAELEKVGAAD
jgi:DNA gyrase subunit A